MKSIGNEVMEMEMEMVVTKSLQLCDSVAGAICFTGCIKYDDTNSLF